jgi:hypothetical protein
MHDETYRMLGREREADFEREAKKWQFAAEVRGSRSRPSSATETERIRESPAFARRRIVAFFLRAARA